MKVKIQNTCTRPINLGVPIKPGEIVEVEDCDGVHYAELEGKVKILSARNVKEPLSNKKIITESAKRVTKPNKSMEVDD